MFGFLNTAKQFTGLLVAKITGSSKSILQSNNLSQWGAIIRYMVRLSLLLVIMFIFVWWPVSTYTPNGFDEWSKRMADLPTQVWAIISAILLFWGTGEIMAARNPAPPPNDTTPDDPYEPDLGRFSNLTNDPSTIDGMTEPNPIIEEWIDNETTDS